MCFFFRYLHTCMYHECNSNILYISNSSALSNWLFPCSLSLFICIHCSAAPVWVHLNRLIHCQHPAATHQSIQLTLIYLRLPLLLLLLLLTTTYDNGNYTNPLGTRQRRRCSGSTRRALYCSPSLSFALMLCHEYQITNQCMKKFALIQMQKANQSIGPHDREEHQRTEPKSIKLLFFPLCVLAQHKIYFKLFSNCWLKPRVSCLVCCATQWGRQPGKQWGRHKKVTTTATMGRNKPRQKTTNTSLCKASTLFRVSVCVADSQNASTDLMIFYTIYANEARERDRETALLCSFLSAN